MKGLAMRGEMLWFNQVKDYGFIRTDEGERLRVDGSGFAAGELPEGRCAEKVVTFEVEEGEEGRRAQNVVFEPHVAARRARLRGSGRGVTR
jgi:cold shock CspA family protein